MSMNSNIDTVINKYDYLKSHSWFSTGENFVLLSGMRKEWLERRKFKDTAVMSLWRLLDAYPGIHQINKTAQLTFFMNVKST